MRQKLKVLLFSLLIIFTMTFVGCTNSQISNKCKVTFVGTNGETLKEIYVEPNQSINEAYPENNGFTELHGYFEYGSLANFWKSTDDIESEEFDFDTPITQNTKIYQGVSNPDFLYNLVFELSKDGTYYSIVGTKYYNLTSESDSFDSVDSYFNDVIYVPQTYNGLPIKDIVSIEVKEIVTYDVDSETVINTIEGTKEVDSYAQKAVVAQFSIIEKIYPGVFSDYHYITCMFPSTLKDIDGAFKGCNFASVEFYQENNIETMNEAFYRCEEVKFEIPDTVEEANNAFGGVQSSLITFPQNTKRDTILCGMFSDIYLEELVLPSTIKVIEPSAFTETYIGSIYVPKSVQIQEYDIFENANIEELYFEESISVWGEYIETYEYLSRFGKVYTKENGKYVLVQ